MLLIAESHLEWFRRSEGVFFWPQVLIAAVALTLVLSSLDWVRIRIFAPPRVVKKLEQAVAGDRHGEALSALEKESSPLADVLRAAFSAYSQKGTLEGVNEAIDVECEAVEISLERRLTYLSTIANVALMVGLLGTVWGLMLAFMAIGSSEGVPHTGKLAENVSQALATTVAGLLVAIPSMFVYGHLRGTSRQVVYEMERLARQIIERLPANISRCGPIPAESLNRHDKTE